MAVNLLSF